MRVGDLLRWRNYQHRTPVLIVVISDWSISSGYTPFSFFFFIVGYIIAVLHIGHSFLTFVHVSMHFGWKLCMHGKTATSVPSGIFCKHTPQIPLSSGDSALLNGFKSYRALAVLSPQSASLCSKGTISFAWFLCLLFFIMYSIHVRTIRISAHINVKIKNVLKEINRNIKSKIFTESAIVINCLMCVIFNIPINIKMNDGLSGRISGRFIFLKILRQKICCYKFLLESIDHEWEIECFPSLPFSKLFK